ncbi:polysaccharide biosynthesis tyrosine autokinase [Phycicoccus duodecadis]|uniref:Capsular exopolysaccharide synthesis family protein n=1 Tax=Phycicoccus duodecadis TaxID=173053 RepID=A0A2N3YKR1_9MICO|nr:polysaccharide biosynthesis tyrosine autokinase [Phycicoccus duodecadis]PKW27457.1 capsular exopolysaccharide synthesis family protein [Phycicoccus duodecadis]
MTLLEAVRIARRFWSTIAICVAAALAVAGAYAATQPRLYSASSEAYVQIGGGTGSVSEVSVGNNVASAKAAAYAPLTRSGMVADRVIASLGLKTTPAQVAAAISYATEPESPRIQVFVTSGSPQEAKNIADAVVGATAEVASIVEGGRPGSAARTVRLIPVTTAAVPTAPVSPDVEKLLALGLAGGLVLAYLVVMARLRLDTRIRRVDDVTGLTSHGVIGTIPRSRDLKQRLHSESLLSGPVGEALRHLRTNLVYADPDHAPRTVIVTSPQPGEGKSTISALLARSLALRGERVVLVDGDLRRPMVATLFDVRSGLGLTQVLSGAVPLREALVATDTPGLTVLPAGRIPHNPSEVVGSERMRQLLDHLGQDHLVIVDAPPTLPVTDALVLAQRADGVLVVSLMGRSRKEQLKRTLELAEGVHAKVLGVVVNGIPQGRSAGVYGYESYGYEQGTTSRAGMLRRVLSRARGTDPDGTSDPRPAGSRPERAGGSASGDGPARAGAAPSAADPAPDATPGEPDLAPAWLTGSDPAVR